MAKRLQFKRLIWLAILLVLAFAGLGYRLVDLQVLHHGELSAKGERNTRHEYLIEPRRGDILDVKGSLLAASDPVKTVCADPAMLGGYQAEVAHVLAPLLQENEAHLYQRLLPRLRRNARGQVSTNMFVELKRKVSVETWQKIQQAVANVGTGSAGTNLTRAERTFLSNLRRQAIFARNDQTRSYPNQSLAAHVLGFATTEPREVDDFPVNEIVGQDGVEEQWDAQLAGQRGWRQVETDRQRRELFQWREQDVGPRDGLNVVLTLDSVIQRILEAALAEGFERHTPISISGVVIRPRTGEILALASLPTYDPNNPGGAPPEARRNRVIADMAEPGSVFKIVVVSGALDQGVVSLSDVFECEHGAFHFAGRVLHDHDSYGALTVEKIITKSSNIGAAKIGIKMGPPMLYDYIQRFGFGAATGLPLPGEVSAARYVRPVKDWGKVAIAQIPMGQGIAVTPIQMVLAMCAIANQGVLMRPMLVDRLEDRDHRVVAKYTAQPVRQVMSPATARLMVTALKTVTSPAGTAPKAALEHFTVAGKTGTAQKVENGRYAHDKYFASFIGFFPADAPEICIGVMINQPKRGYYGGQVAAPLFKQIAERAANYLALPPDKIDGETLGETVGGTNALPAAKTANVAARIQTAQ